MNSLLCSNSPLAKRLGGFYTKKMQFEKAYALYQSILLKDRSYINAYNNQADIVCSLLQQPLALQRYEKAFSLNEKRLDIYSNLLMTCPVITLGKK